MHSEPIPPLRRPITSAHSRGCTLRFGVNADVRKLCISNNDATDCRAVGCKQRSSGPAERLKCLRDKPINKILEPYISWACPPFTKSPWCNKTAAANSISGDGIVPGYSDSGRYARDVAASIGGGGGGGNVGAPWPGNRAPFAPIVGFAAIVDGTEDGLPDTPYRMMQQGKVNVSPTGEPIQLLIGTNADELALFLVALSLVIPDIHYPINATSVKQIAEHLVAYHDHWNSTTVEQILAAYPESDFKGKEAYRMIRAGTDALFRCGTRLTANVLSDAGFDVYLYEFVYHFFSYKSPESEGCDKDRELLCGVYHVRPVYVYARVCVRACEGFIVFLFYFLFFLFLLFYCFIVSCVWWLWWVWWCSSSSYYYYLFLFDDVSMCDAVFEAY